MRRPAVPAGLAAALLALSVAGCAPGNLDGSPHRVFVILGFHGNFYHSWRGDTPDEAGFGTDIRVVRELIRMLDVANASGLDARAYWDIDHHFTLESILPEYAPDIVEGIRRRVAAGRDEILLAPYTNGMTSAMTREEARASLRWAIANPWGSGADDLFGTHTPLFRPQEGMVTAGFIDVLRDEGVEGIVLAYSGYPFTTFTSMVPALPPEQRYNPTWLRLRPDGPRTILFPCVSIGDVLNHVSLEKWMLELRALQVSGAVDRDLVIHINFDADAESWLPQELPFGLGWMPNAGGLEEYIRYVNKYAWASFTTPGRYLAEHAPEGEVVVRQDLADGAFDGNTSWAEKLPSHAIWTEIERSRLATRRAEALFASAPAALRTRARRALYEGRDSSFFQRLRALSTTHFGMSTPIVNEERQAAAESIASRARERAEGALRALADHEAARVPAAGGPPPFASYLVRDVRDEDGLAPALQLLRIPVLMRSPVPALTLRDEAGDALPHALVNVESLGPGTLAAELRVPLRLAAGETRRLDLIAAGAPSAEERSAVDRLDNGRIAVRFDAEHGIASLRRGGFEIGGEDFLAPFVSYAVDDEPRTFSAGPWESLPLPGERWQGLTRARMRTRIPFATQGGDAAVRIEVDYTLPEGASWIVADVTVSYPYTEKRDLLHTIQQKLRRAIDLRWIEVAPFQLEPRLVGTRPLPLRVFKHNYLDVTSSYPLDYARINERNAELDAFNHQITAAWVAVSDGEHGLLLAQNADVRSSFAMTPMRLREEDGRQRLSLNPFGSYHGAQLDHSHLGGNGIGSEFAVLVSAALRPNAPSYNGETERFSLLLAPYDGAAPPRALQREAEAFFHPPAVVALRSPPGLRLPSDVRQVVAGMRRGLEREATGPLPAPRAFLVNPTIGAVDVVWDEPADARVRGYEIVWQPIGDDAWTTVAVPSGRRHRVAGLADGVAYAFRMRAVAPGIASPWTEALTVEVGPVEPVNVASVTRGASVSLLLRTFYYGVVHALTTP